MKSLFSTVLFVASSFILNAQSIEDISKRYLEAYFNLDQSTYAEFLSDDIEWSDPTWSEVDPNNVPVKGKEQVLNHLKSATAGISDMEYVIEKHFVSGNIGVFEGWLSYKWLDAEQGKTYEFRIREVSILVFQEGRIVKHTDYSDFKTWLSQYRSQT